MFAPASQLRVAFRTLLFVLLTVPLVAAPTWQKLETKDVVIYSDASPKDIVEFAVGYSTFRQAFREVFAPPLRVPPATILLYRTHDEMEQDLPPQTKVTERTLSSSCNVDGAVLTAVCVDGDRQELLRQIYQSDTIWALQRAGFVVPLWMSQGAGEVMESLRVDGPNAEIGPRAFYSWPSAPLDWPVFFGLGTSSSEYRKPGSLFHPQAWGLMHRVLLGGGKPADNFKALAVRLQSEEPIKALETTLGVEVAKFGSEIRRHLRTKPKFNFVANADQLRKTLVPAPASMVEVLVQRSNLLYAEGRTDQGEIELARAQGLAPANSPLIKEARARAAVRERRFGDAAALYNEAIELGSTSPAVYVRAAEQLLNQLTSGNRMSAGGGGLASHQAADLVRKALERDPGNPDAYVQLGRAFFMMPDLREDDVAELSRGVTEGPAGLVIRYYRALLYQRLKNERELVADLNVILLDRLTETSLRKLAVEVMVEHVVKPLATDIEAAVKEKRYGEARTKLNGISVEHAAPALVNQVHQLQQWVDEKEAWNAVREAQAGGDAEKAAAAAKTFIERFPKSEAAPRARALLGNAST